MESLTEPHQGRLGETAIPDGNFIQSSTDSH